VKSQVKEFLAEAEDLLGAMEGEIMALARSVNSGCADHIAINKLFRSVHTLKGLSSIFEFTDIVRLSHALEDKFDMLRLGRIVLDDNCLAAITNAHSLLCRIIGNRAYTGFSDEVNALISALLDYGEMKGPKGEIILEDDVLSSLTEYERFRLTDNIKEGKRILMVNAAFELSAFDEEYSVFSGALNKTGEVIATLPSRGKDGPNLFFDTLIATSDTPGDIELKLCCNEGVQIRELECHGGVKALDKRGQSPPANGSSDYVESMRRNARTIRVDVEKIEHLMGCLDDIRALRKPFEQLKKDIGEANAGAACSFDLKKFDTELNAAFSRMRECVIAIKMVRVGRLFKRFEPYIERVAHARGQEICITTYGEDTELDMTVIEEIADPLMHIIRNVMEHAIEPPAKRLACGKSREGTITLSAYYEGEKIVVEVKDDGRGIDPEAICARAVNKGFIDDAEASELNRHDKLNLIFMPGFSTKDEINLASGRGVGLDVVKENVSMLNGIVELETVRGKGTRFILTIPVAPVMKGLLMCEEGGKSFALAGSLVEEVMELKDGASLSEGFITINNVKTRAIRPSELFQNISAPSGESAYAIVASIGSARLCLVVDKVLRELNMIIRPLPFEHKISGILGLSEAVDNESVLVLDVAGILDLLSSGENNSFSHRPIV